MSTLPRWKRAIDALFARPRRPRPAFLLAERTIDELFPDASGAEPRLPAPLGEADEWALPAPELAALAAICARLRPRRAFEIGTYTGGSTLVIAMNAAPEAEVLTLDLDPAARGTHAHGLGVGGFPDFAVGARFAGHEASSRVRQLYGDSRSFDFAPYRGTIDLVLIDADHTDAFVERDTANALAMLRPGGVVVWDDYLWSERHPECAGVTRCVDRLAATRPIYRLAGTRLAVHVSAASER